MSANTRIGVDLDPEIKRQLRIEAARRGSSMSELARETLEEWVEENTEEPVDS